MESLNSTPSKPWSGSSRYDWRLRAPSQAKISSIQPANSSLAADKDSRHASIPKRVKPPPPKPGGPYHDAIEGYKDRFLPLLQFEQEEEESVIRERLSTWSLPKLKEEGYTLTGLSAYWLDGTRFGKPMASFSLGPGLTLPEHKFENGTPVLLSRIDPLLERPSRGSILSTSSSHLTVSFPDRSFELDLPADDTSGWRLDLGQSDYVYELMRSAINSFGHDVLSQERAGVFLPPPNPNRNANAQSDSEYILTGTQLTDVLLRSFEPSEHPHHHRALQAPDETSYVAHNVLEHDYHPESLPTGAVRTDKTTTTTTTSLPSDNRGAFSDNLLIQSWAQRYSRPNPVVVEGDPDFEELRRMNDTQKRAMAMMLGERISLVQGPPGTGKTLTIISTIKLLKTIYQVPHPLLVCTYTNVAVDNLVEGLARAGLKPLRAASAGKTREELKRWTLQDQLEAHPRYGEWQRLEARAKKITEALKEVNRRLREMEREEFTGGKALSERDLGIKKRMMEDVVRKKRALGAVKKMAYGLEQGMIREIVENADVICTTCITSASAALNIIDFPVVFLDEASMSTEPASLIPLMKGSRHVALIGDHKQLPPVITSPEAQAMGLAVSLFERLTEEGVVPSIMLNTQYRMHPAISHFPSLEFYNSALLDGTADKAGYILPRLMPPAVSSALLPPGVLTGLGDGDGGSESMLDDGDGKVQTSTRPPVIFLDHAGNESAKAKSRVNLNEAHIVASVVEDLLLNNNTLLGKDIGIIAPYVAQISLLTKLLNTDPVYKTRFESVLGSHRAMQLSHIEIKTVDGFEGREKEIIIFSTVRNNSGGYIGFLADRRRLNVGLTRAKRGLFVVGSLSTLRESKTRSNSHADADATVSEASLPRVGKGKGAESWRRYVRYVGDHGLVLNLQSREALAKVLYGNVNAARRITLP